MTAHLTILGAVTLVAALVSTPARLYGRAPQAPDPQHDQHHPLAAAQTATPATTGSQADMMGMMANMKVTSARLDALVKKMDAATGAAKTAAMAELLTALVEDRRTTCEAMQAQMTSMMNMMGMMGGRRGNSGASTTPPR